MCSDARAILPVHSRYLTSLPLTQPVSLPLVSPHSSHCSHQASMEIFLSQVWLCWFLLRRLQWSPAANSSGSKFTHFTCEALVTFLLLPSCHTPCAQLSSWSPESTVHHVTNACAHPVPCVTCHLMSSQSSSSMTLAPYLQSSKQISGPHPSPITVTYCWWG